MSESETSVLFRTHANNLGVSDVTVDAGKRSVVKEAYKSSALDGGSKAIAIELERVRALLVVAAADAATAESDASDAVDAAQVVVDNAEAGEATTAAEAALAIVQSAYTDAQAATTAAAAEAV